jgi:methylenetetrahydrofolate--tRNA-(uracil-5-)-methyltransferase
MPSVCIIGAGLAGSEAALVLLRHGVAVTLCEMKPVRFSPAHTTALPAELVCSNSLKSQQLPAAQALLKEELALLDSPLLCCARQSAVAAGMALAVDRKVFSRKVLTLLQSHPSCSLLMKELSGPLPGHDCTIVATGPLSSDAMVQWLTETFSPQALYFYDAIAPIVSFESIDRGQAFFASRWQKGGEDYLNCPFTEEEYRKFYDALVEAESVRPHSFESERYFEACLPVEIIAKRGYEALSFGQLKPVGLRDPRTGKRPYAVCQLRRENSAGDSFSMVGFQTRLTGAEQQLVFRLIPGLERAEFLRYGSCHRNTFLNSPDLLSEDLSFKTMPQVFLAGQLTGNEGYVESIATGHCAALYVLSRIKGKSIGLPPATTALGSLLRYITGSSHRPFSPTGFHYGLLPPPDGQDGKKLQKKEKQMLLCTRALRDFKSWIDLFVFG